MIPEQVHSWIKRNWDHDLNPDQMRCAMTLCAMAQVYNLPILRVGRLQKPSVDVHPHYVGIHLESASLSTFDSSELTRLVVAAHRNHVRVSISATTVWSKHIGDDLYLRFVPKSGYDPDRFYDRGYWGQGCLAVYAYHRTPDGDLMERHPGLDELRSSLDSESRDSLWSG